MDKVILNGNKARFYNEGNTQSGSIQYTDSKLSIKGNSAGSGVLITDGKLHLKSGTSTSSIIYDSSTDGVSFPDGLITVGTNTIISNSIYVPNTGSFGVSINADNAHSLNTPFVSGFGGTGWAITKSDTNKYIAQFDDLWVRGSMNVYEMVINQIRATNGSLWVSDAAKAISASYDGSKFLNIYFPTSSIMPFVISDILRSKRWTTSPDGTSSIWDIIIVVGSYSTAESYVKCPVASAITSSNLGNWYTIAQILSTSGSDWVRVGNLIEPNRRGAIYLTSNDIGGPFLDVYDGVSDANSAYGGTSQSVISSKVKVRLGKLTGIVDPTFNPSALSGYGLYSDNVYLKGTIRASAGTIGDWSIGSGGLTAAHQGVDVRITPTQISFNDWNGDYLLIGKNSSCFNGYGIGYFPDGDYVNPYFKVDKDGAFLSGTITASAGKIGGWTITDNKLYSGNVTISAQSTHKYIGLGTSVYDQSGIYIGSSSNGNRLSLVGGPNKLLWSGEDLQIISPNFTLSTIGNISASNAILGGQIIANSGKIAGWDISGDKLYAYKITFSGGDSPFISLGGATAVNAGNGLFLTSSTDNAFIRIGEPSGSLNKFIQWNGSDLIVNSTNFRLSNGTISASNVIIAGKVTANQGSIANWDIQPNFLQSTGISIRTQTSSLWNRVSKTGVDYNDITGELFGVYNSHQGWFNDDNNTTLTLPLNQGSPAFQSYSDGYKNVIFTSSFATNGAILAYTTSFLPIPANTKLYFGIKHAKITTSLNSPYQKQFNQSQYYDSIWFQLVNSVGNAILAEVPLFDSNTRYTSRTDVQFAIQNDTPNPINTKLNLRLKTQWPEASSHGIYTISFMSMIVTTASSYTELNPDGLLVWAGPTNFIKISTNKNNQYSVLAADDVLIGGQSIKGGTVGGTNVITGGSGVPGLSYDEDSTIVSQHTISAPAFTGDGFVFAGSNTALSTVGNITSGQDLSDLSIKQILDAMLLYAKPTLTSPTPSNGGSSYYYETGSTIGAGGTIYQASTKLTNYGNLMPGTGLTMSFVRNNSSVILGSKSVTTDTTHTVTFTMTAETGSYNKDYATSVKATITNSKGVITEASRAIYFRAPVFAFTNTQSSFTDAQFVTAIRSGKSNKTINKVNLAKGETYTTPANSSGGTVQAYLAWPASWTFTPSSMKMYGNPCGATLISQTMGYTSSVNPDVKLQYKLLAVGDPQTNPAALSLQILG